VLFEKVNSTLVWILLIPYTTSFFKPWKWLERGE